MIIGIDEPIFVQDWAPKRVPSRGKGDSIEDRLEEAIRFDDNKKFLDIINDPEFLESDYWHGNGYEQFDPCYMLWKYDALECGIAVLEGKTNDRMDAYRALADGENLIHVTAEYGASKLFGYLIEKAEKEQPASDVRELLSKPCLKHETPLDLALASLTHVHLVHRSICNLLYYLCISKRKNLEIIRILATKTQSSLELRQRIVSYAEDGKIIQFAALFLAVPLMFLTDPEPDNCLLNYVYEKCRNEWGEIRNKEKLLLLLDVFLVVGDKLAAYIRIKERSSVGCGFQLILSLLQEVATKNAEVSSHEDYLHRFFKRDEGYLKILMEQGALYEVANTRDKVADAEDMVAAERLNEAIKQELSGESNTQLKLSG